MSSSVSLQQLGGKSQLPASAVPGGVCSRSLSRQGSDDGTSLDGSERSSCGGHFGFRDSSGGRRSVDLHAPSPALPIERNRTPPGIAQPSAAGVNGSASSHAAGASPAAAPATPTAAEEAGGKMTWAVRLARSTAGLQPGGSGGRASPCGSRTGASSPAPSLGTVAAPAEGGGGAGAVSSVQPAAVAAPVTPRTAESPHAVAATPPDVAAAAQQLPPTASAAPASSPPPGHMPQQRQALAPASWTAFGVAAGRVAPAEDSRRQQQPCARCTAAKSDLVAAVHAATVLHKRMTLLERQVCLLNRSAASLLCFSYISFALFACRLGSLSVSHKVADPAESLKNMCLA